MSSTSRSRLICKVYWKSCDCKTQDVNHLGFWYWYHRCIKNFRLVWIAVTSTSRSRSHITNSRKEQCRIFKFIPQVQILRSFHEFSEKNLRLSNLYHWPMPVFFMSMVKVMELFDCTLIGNNIWKLLKCLETSRCWGQSPSLFF